MEKQKRKRRRKHMHPAAIVVIIVCSVTLAIALSQIIRIMLEYRHIEESNNQVVGSITFDEPLSPEFKYEHDSALAINADAKGLYFNPGTDTMLPVVQRDGDDDYYLHRDFYGEYSRGGTLFIAGDIKEGLDATHVIIYGHHMNDDSMFTKNNNYKEESFYKEANHDTFYLYTPDSLREYKIFSIYNTDPDGPVYKINHNAEELISFAEECKNRSFYDTGVNVSKATQIVTLSSCEATDYNYRLVVQGVLVNETPFENK